MFPRDTLRVMPARITIREPEPSYPFRAVCPNDLAMVPRHPDGSPRWGLIVGARIPFTLED